MVKMILQSTIKELYTDLTDSTDFLRRMIRRIRVHPCTTIAIYASDTESSRIWQNCEWSVLQYVQHMGEHGDGFVIFAQINVLARCVIER